MQCRWWWWNRWISYLFLPTAIKWHWMEGLVWWIRMDGWLMYVNPYPYWTNKRGIQGLQVATSTLALSGNNWKLRFAQAWMGVRAESAAWRKCTKPAHPRSFSFQLTMKVPHHISSTTQPIHPQKGEREQTTLSHLKWMDESTRSMDELISNGSTPINFHFHTQCALALSPFIWHWLVLKHFVLNTFIIA